MVRRRSILALSALLAGGCGVFGGMPTPPVAVPTKLLDLGTVPVGKGKEVRVRVPATAAEREVFGAGTTIGVNSNDLALTCVGSGPGYLEFLATTREVANCDGFSTSVGVDRDGVTVLNLEVKAKVRRAFEVTPIVEGKRYGIKLAPGVGLPEAIDHSAGIAAEIRSTGTGRAELILRRTGPELVPFGMVRLIDRASGDMRLIKLPISLEHVGVFSERSGGLFAQSQDLVVTADGDLRPDARGVEVVLDPPDAYRVVRRGAVDGKFAVVLRSRTRRPTDVSVGLRRNGRWIEVQRILPD